MAVLDAAALAEHVVGLGARRGRVVCVDVGAHVGEEVGALARGLQRRFEGGEFAAVGLQDFAVPREVVLFEGRGGEGRFGVEKAG